MGGPDTPPPGQNMSQVLNAYNQYLPSILSNTANQIPGISQLQSQALLNSITGTGGQAAKAAAGLESQLNPSYRLANQVAGAINLNGLSPGESNAVERGLNQNNTRSGNLGLINPTNIVNNAMNFGGAFNNKVQLASGATGSTASGMGGFSPTGVASGQPVTGTTLGFGSNLMGNMGSMNNALIGAQASTSNATSIPQYLNGVCCFIFLEAYHGRLPKCVRRGRDGYYNSNYHIAVGYRRMASWLVPLMQENNFIRAAVWHLMVNPITKHLQHPKRGWRKTLTHTWLKFWGWYGRNSFEVEHYKEFNYKPIYV